MSVAKVSEISATSTKSFEDAIQQGIARAGKTLRHIKSAWIKEQRISLNDGDLNTLHTQLVTAVGEELANFIIAYRLYGQPAQNLEAVSAHELVEAITDGAVGLVPGDVPVAPLAWYDERNGEK